MYIMIVAGIWYHTESQTKFRDWMNWGMNSVGQGSMGKVASFWTVNGDGKLIAVEGM